LYVSVAIALSTLFILVATLHSAGNELVGSWSFALTSGYAALAELFQNLLLFIPLGASLALAGVRPLRAVAIGAALSFSVEFLQQWIPGRDPSVGDIVCNTVSTGVGMALVVGGPRLLWIPAARAARQALGLAAVAVLVWYSTGLVLRPVLPEPPYRDFWTPDWDFWGHYRGKVISARLGGVTLRQDTLDEGQFLLKTGQALQVTTIASSRPPGREAPLVALVDEQDTKVLVFFVYGADLGVRYHMKAIELTLENVDLRFRGALAHVAPKDTFVAQIWRGENRICLSLNSARRCGFGYTIGDGWKLIFYPAHFPAWLNGLLNMMWLAGWMVGVGWWSGKATLGKATVLGAAAIVLPVVALVIVPMMTGLKPTPISEWLGAILGLGAGIAASRRFRVPRRFGIPVR